MNSSKTAPKDEPARHWIDGEWVGSSTVEDFQEVRTQIRAGAHMPVDHPRTQTP